MEKLKEELNKKIKDFINLSEEIKIILRNNDPEGRLFIVENIGNSNQKQYTYEEMKSKIDQLVSELEVWKISNFTKHVLIFAHDMLEEYYTKFEIIRNDYMHNILKNYDGINSVLLELTNEIKRVKYLSYIKEDKNAVLVGGNGVGKSSFASYLKDSLSNNILVIQAQKFLFFDPKIQDLHLTEKKHVNSIQKDNFIGRARFEDQGDSDYQVATYKEDVSQLFSKFITSIVNEQIQINENLRNKNDEDLNLKSKEEETIFLKLESLWEKLIPDIKFRLDTIKRTLIPIKIEEGKEDKEYLLNAMSDGEKSMLYYISYVLLAEPDSFIVVDEPETFLNASNFNRLWDTLEAYRHDCKFIYISHVVDFIVSRTNADLIWCKKFNYPDNWELKVIDADSEISKKFPKELLSELLGARDPILFCEGQKSSLDYSVYSILFEDRVIVYPVGGHSKVIQYTRAYNNLTAQFNGNKALGIIDADLMSDEQIEKYKGDSIYTLYFNEIEMLLLSEEVIRDVLGRFENEKDKMDQKIKSYKTEFFKAISSNLDSILFEQSKKYVDTELSNYRFDEKKIPEKTPKEISKRIEQWIEDLNIVDESEKFEIEIIKLIEEEKYEELLRICPLKKTLIKGVANIFLDSYYREKAIKRMEQNKNLAKNIKETYFKDLLSKIMSL